MARKEFLHKFTRNYMQGIGLSDFPMYKGIDDQTKNDWGGRENPTTKVQFVRSLYPQIANERLDGQMNVVLQDDICHFFTLEVNKYIVDSENALYNV